MTMSIMWYCLEVIASMLLPIGSLLRDLDRRGYLVHLVHLKMLFWLFLLLFPFHNVFNKRRLSSLKPNPIWLDSWVKDSIEIFNYFKRPSWQVFKLIFFLSLSYNRIDIDSSCFSFCDKKQEILVSW